MATDSSINSIISTVENPLPKGMFDEKGAFKRPQAAFRDFVSSEPGAKFAPEKGRYHLYVSYACPWAHRVLIVHKLKGLEDIIPFTAVHYHMSLTTSWRFVKPEEVGTVPMGGSVPNPLHPEFTHLSQVYKAADPEYPGRFSVPVLWDTKPNTIVSNESSEIIRMLYTEFDHLLPEEKRAVNGGVDLYPEELRKEIDEANEWMYDGINNGVYKCGMGKTQEAYKAAVDNLFSCLDRVETHLKSSPGPFYFGDQVSEVDVRLYVTIVRFDAVYVSLFKTNKTTVRGGYPAIHKWLRNLYWNVPAFHETTNFEQIKGHYFKSLTIINPSGIVPDGPVPHVEPL